MKYLIDTHTLIWFFEGHHLLSNDARLILESVDNLPIVSNDSNFDLYPIQRKWRRYDT